MFVMKSNGIRWVFAFSVASIACSRAKPSSPPQPDGTVAVVGGVPITRPALDHQVQRLPAVIRARYDSADGRKQLLDTMVQGELLVREAERRGYDKDPEYQRLIKQQLVDHLLTRALDGKTGPQDIPNADAERHYQAHQSDYARPEQVRVGQILVKDRQVAVRLQRSARVQGRDASKAFADLGIIDRSTSTLSPVLLAGAYALENPGDVSDVLETEQGYHILRLTERLAGGPRPFAEVKEQIKAQLFQQRRNELSTRLLNESRARFKVEIFDSQIKAGSAVNVAAKGK